MALTFSVATSNDYKNKAGEWVKRPATWTNCVYYGRFDNQKAVAEEGERRLTKGSPVYVEGRERTREYEKDGEKRTSTELMVSMIAIPIVAKRGGDAVEGNPETPNGNGKKTESFDEGFFVEGEEADIPF